MERVLRRLRRRLHPRPRRHRRPAPADRSGDADGRRRRRRLGARRPPRAGRRAVPRVSAVAAADASRAGPVDRAARVDGHRAGVRPRHARRVGAPARHVAGLRGAVGAGRRAVPGRRRGDLRRGGCAGRATARRVRGRPVRDLAAARGPAAHRGPDGAGPRAARPGRGAARVRCVVLARPVRRWCGQRRAPAPVAHRHRGPAVLGRYGAARPDRRRGRGRRGGRRRPARAAGDPRRVGAVAAAPEAGQLGRGVRLLGAGEPGGGRAAVRGDARQPARRARRAEVHRRQRQPLPGRDGVPRAGARRDRAVAPAAGRGARGPGVAARGAARPAGAGVHPGRGAGRAGGLPARSRAPGAGDRRRGAGRAAVRAADLR